MISKRKSRPNKKAAGISMYYSMSSFNLVCIGHMLFAPNVNRRMNEG